MIIFLSFLSLFLGINLAFYCSWGWIIFLVIFLFILFRKLAKKHFLICSLFVALGSTSIIIKQEIPREVKQLTGVVYEAKNNYFLLQSLRGKYYISEKNHSRETGDIIKFRGYTQKINFSHLESQFDFKEYLRKKGVEYEFVAKEKTVILNNLVRPRQMIADFLKNFDETTREHLASIVFLQSSEELYETFSDVGVTYLLSAIGVYCLFLKRIIERFLSIFIKNREAVNNCSLAILSLYFVFLPLKLFIIRLFFMAILQMIYRKNKMRLAYHNGISLFGLFLLFIDPFLALQMGFIYSFVLLFALIKIRKLQLYKEKWRNKIGQTASIFSIILLLQMSSNYEINLLFPLYQIILTPLYMGIFLVGIFSFFVFPLKASLNFLVSLSAAVMHICQKISFKITVGEPSVYFLLFLGGIILLVIHFGHLKVKKGVLLFKNVFFLALLLQCFPATNYFSSEIAFINVGQGDAIFIRQRRSTMLVDTGGNLRLDLAEECLIPFLKKRKVQCLDYLVTTHNDYDHMGARASLVAQFPVKNLLSSKSDFPLMLGETPIYNLNDYNEFDTDNNKSLVLYFTLAKHTFLLTGDLEKEGEKRLLSNHPDISAEYLKIGHHGSNTSSSIEFLKKVNPRIAIISVGKNSYGHPHKEIIERLEMLGISYLRTDEKGTIRFCYYHWV